MEPSSALVIGVLAKKVTGDLVAATGRHLRTFFAAPEKEAALTRCVEAGILGMVLAARVDDEQRQHLESVVRMLFDTEEIAADLGRALTPLLRGQPLDVIEMTALAKAAGFDPAALPGFDLETSWQAFAAGFSAAALEQSVLREELDTQLLVAQVEIQSDIRDALRRMVRQLEGARDGIRLEAGQITAVDLSGARIVFEAPPLPPSSASEWEPFYLRSLSGHCDQLDLTPIDERDAGMSVRLSDVFTTLDLEGLQRRRGQNVAEVFARHRGPRSDEKRSPRPEEEEDLLPVTAVEAVAAVPRLIVLGRPGGGKSTLVNHLVVQLARRRLGRGLEADVLPGWPEDAAPLPVRVLLRRFAAWLPPDARPDAGLVWDYLEHQLERAGSRQAFEGFQRCLRQEGGVVFFDGLDEVHEEDLGKRSLLCKAIELFAEPLESCRVVVTCREYAYLRGDAWRLSGDVFTEVMLAVFGPAQVKAFTDTWYRVLGPAKGWDRERSSREAEHLARAVEEWTHLRELAESPLLLTLMAQIHGRDGYLPRDRADLYERTVNLLLAHWENRIVRDLETKEATSGQDRVLKLDLRIDVLRSALEKVAFEAHEQQEKETARAEATADIPTYGLLRALEEQLGDLRRAREVIAYIQQRAGLLLALDQDTYRFPHRTFQEYLAARHILKQGEYEAMLRDRVKRDLGWWREVFLLAAGSSRETPRVVSDLVDELVPRAPTAADMSPETAESARLAAQALEVGRFAERVRLEGEGRFAATFEKIQLWLVHAMTATQKLEPATRAGCGAALAVLGDPRVEVMTVERMEFCLVPGGPFWMGDDDSPHNDEKPAHLVEHLTETYWISRFPVTVAQFRQYVEASDAKIQNVAALSGQLNAPVADVTWFEALDFCRWLSEPGLLPEGWQARLPTETEWEKAARGGVDIPAAPVALPISDRPEGTVSMVPNTAPKRQYPWPGKFDPNRCNAAETGIKTVSAVGCFPQGQSVYGCEEMSGNVWEWTVTEWDGKAHSERAADLSSEVSAADLAASASGADRVVRGGSYWDGAGNARAAYRNWFDPGFEYPSRGFRVLLPSPPPRGL